jgi:hypothetical protein
VQIESSRGVLFKFCRPSGAPAQEPSVAMRRARQSLSEADEMRKFVAEAHAQRKDVVMSKNSNVTQMFEFGRRNGHTVIMIPRAAADPNQDQRSSNGSYIQTSREMCVGCVP